MADLKRRGDGRLEAAPRGDHTAEVTDTFIWAAETFGGVIRRAREARGLTQRELAKRCEEEISSVYVSQIEKGERVPSLRVCRLLAHALALDEKRLMLLAYETNTPKEIRELLAREEAQPYGLMSKRLERLVSSVGRLSPAEQDELTDLWQPLFSHFFVKKAAR